MFEGENKKFSNTQWLSNCEPAEKAFHGLMAVTHNLLRPGDKITLPSIAAPYAWRAMWAIYQELLARKRSTQATASTPVDSGRQQAADAQWNQYCQNRQRFIDFKSTGAISNTAADYLGIQDGDLDSAHVEHPKFGSIPHQNWGDRASRISTALSRWANMSEHERTEIPQRLAARNLARRIVRLEEAATKEQAQ
jgi:hypothetical protein